MNYASYVWFPDTKCPPFKLTLILHLLSHSISFCLSLLVVVDFILLLLLCVFFFLSFSVRCYWNRFSRFCVWAAAYKFINFKHIMFMMLWCIYVGLTSYIAKMYYTHTHIDRIAWKKLLEFYPNWKHNGKTNSIIQYVAYTIFYAFISSLYSF